MIDINKQVSFWHDSAGEDWLVGRALIRQRRTRHGLFFIHLAFEKALKAEVCRVTRELAPRIHNLVRLAELAALDLTEGQADLLADLNAYNLEGRYPDALAPPLTAAEARAFVKRAESVFKWLISLS